jgi:Amt family ammonium transporter
VLGTACGAIAGLVAITPACGFVTPMAAIIIGLVAGGVCYLACHLKTQSNKFDDSLDVFGVHGIGGVWGMIATGIFATVAVNAGGGNGLIAGNPQQLVTQLIAVAVTAVFTFVVTFILLKIVEALFGLRVDPHEEIRGLDASQHGEAAYQNWVIG